MSDLLTTTQQERDNARDEERAAVVAWLREQMPPAHIVSALDFGWLRGRVDAIERGDHRPPSDLALAFAAVAHIEEE